MEKMENDKNISFKGIHSRIEKKDLLYFLMYGYTFCGDHDVMNFLRFANIGSGAIWRALKEKTVEISFHVGEAFNHVVPEEKQWATLAVYDPICEKETVVGAGFNSISSFHVEKRHIIEYWSNEWRDFKQVAVLPVLKFYSSADGYLLDAKELVFVQEGNEYQMIGMIDKGTMLAKRVKDGKLVTRRPMQFPDGFTVPALSVDTNLQGILGAIEGSASTEHSIIEVYLYLVGETLKETKIDHRFKEHFSGYHENLQAESYTCSKGIITLVTYRCDIDDYDALLFLDGEPVRSTGTQQYRYDKVLGFIKKE